MTPGKQGVDHRQLRAINERRVRRLLLRRGPLSRRDLAAQTGLDSKSITNIIRDLRAREVVAVAGRKKSFGGRSVDLFELRRDRNLVLGIHIAPDRILALVVNPYGETLWQSDRIGSETTKDAIRSAVEDVGHQLRSVKLFRPAHFLGAGLCAPGLLNPERTAWVVSSQLPDLVGEAPGRWVEQATGLPTILEDDSAAKALGERLWGWARCHESFLLVDLDTGVGSGIVINGRLFRGVSGHSGEIGRLKVPADAAAQMGAEGKRLEEAVGLHRIAVHYNRRIGAQRAKHFDDVATASREGDRVAIDVLRSAGQLVGATLANIFDFLNLPICVTGRLVTSTDLTFDPIRESFRRNILLPEGEIGQGELNGRVGALGAAALVYHAWTEA
ncbi:MAG: ROK family protein [Planctomycetota bacterium]